jgi:3-deoxy-D-manno-octulosonate 8-phosphate phosphatase (KDO 8-P phosphatase)
MNALEKFKDIRTFIFDVDGVLTDCSCHVLENGQLLRRINMRDTFAMKMALKKGYRIIIITAGRSEGIKIRLSDLGVQEIFLGRFDKLEVMEDLVAETGLDLGSTLYMGDDLPDYECMRRVHLPTCPANAVREILELSQYVSPYEGGQGCARDVIEKVLSFNGHWDFID